jgi:hypothetical protein
MEIAIHKFISEFRSNPDIPDEELYYKFDEIIKANVDELSSCSDVRYVPNLAKTLIQITDFKELRETNANDYVLRKYIRSIMKMYLEQISKVREIKVKDKVLFRMPMEAIGFNIGFTTQTTERSVIPDGNVLALMIGLIVITSLILLNNSKK